jgi:hypothetical protein
MSGPTMHTYTTTTELTCALSQTIPADLAARGYTNQLCLDFSNTALELMRARHAEEKGIEWRWADVRALEETVASGSVDVAFDKGTLDAMIHGSPWSPPDQVLSDTSRYMREVRVSFFVVLFSLSIPVFATLHFSFWPSLSIFARPNSYFFFVTCCSVGPPHSQTRRHLSVCHFPAAALHQAAVAGGRGGVMGAGHEDSWRRGELF